MTNIRQFLLINLLLLTSLCTWGCGDSDDFIFTTTGNNNVAAAAVPAGLVFQTIPARTAGAAFAPIQVAVVDSAANIVTTATNPITLILNNPGGATISGTTTRNAVNGIATFNDITVDRVGNYTFGATSPGLQGATSANFAITPSTSSQLSFAVQPSDTILDQLFNPTVVVESRDALGNLTDTQITMSINGKPTLNGTLVRDTVNGQANFTDLSVGVGGTFTLTATSTTGATVDSNSFTVASAFNGLILTDRGNRRIVQMDDFAGTNFTPLNQQFNNWGIAINAAGAIFVSDTSGDRIAMYDNIADTTPTLLTGFSQPTGLTLDNQGRLLIADFANDRIVRVDDIAGNNFQAFSGPAGNTFRRPLGLAVDSADRIYVADLNNNRVCRMDDISGTNFVAFSGPAGNSFQEPSDVEIDPAGRILVGERLNNRVVRFDDMTGTNFVAYNGPAGDSLNFVNGLAVDQATGQIFIVDSGNQRLVCIDDIAGAGFIAFGDGTTFDSPIDVALRP